MSNRKMTPKGQMSGNGSGPAIMMMPPNIREAFMPDPPLKHLPPPKRKRPKYYSTNGVQTTKPRTGLTGVAEYMKQFERTNAPKRKEDLTPLKIKEIKQQKKKEKWLEVHGPLIEEYRKEQRESGGEFMNMNCYNTLFVGRLAYEVTERKLLREFETFGPVKDIKLVTVKGGEKDGKSRGYAFIEYEQEEDMKRAYRAADGMKMEGKEIVVDVERGHTVPTWLPRRFGGGLGGTRLGGKGENITRPGRFDPTKPDTVAPSGVMAPLPPMGGYGGRDVGYGGSGRGPPPPSLSRGDIGGYGGPSPMGRMGYGRPPPTGQVYGSGSGGGGGGGYPDRGGPFRGGGGAYGPPPDRYGPGGPRYGGDRDRDHDRGTKRDRDRYDDRDGYHPRRRY